MGAEQSRCAEEQKLKTKQRLARRRKAKRRFFVYIVRCRDKSFYTGLTVDVEHRIKQHNQGRGAKYTASHKPVKLVYQEACSDLSAAMRRELQIKRLTRAAKAELIRMGRRRRRI
ncbi:MAG: GIY-YIG nuclease family protein [candidate division FCPU426 bacterium]